MTIRAALLILATIATIVAAATQLVGQLTDTKLAVIAAVLMLGGYFWRNEHHRTTADDI